MQLFPDFAMPRDGQQVPPLCFTGWLFNELDSRASTVSADFVTAQLWQHSSHQSDQPHSRKPCIHSRRQHRMAFHEILLGVLHDTDSLQLH